MCSAKKFDKAVNVTSRVVSGVLTLGGSEIARNNLSSNNPINKILQTPGRIVTGSGALQKTAAALGVTQPDPVPTPEVPAPADPEATPIPPTPSEQAAMLRRKRLAALRLGIASTIRTSGQGVADVPSLMTPMAAGTGKTKLGQ